MTRPSLTGGRAIAPGLALAIALALVAYGINSAEPRVSALVAALLLGMVVSNVAGGRATLSPGARFAARKVLRVGIALLGLRISLDRTPSSAMPSTSTLRCWPARWLGSV